MVQIIIHGLGFMGQIHARCYAMDSTAEVVAVVDKDTQKASDVLMGLGFNRTPVYSTLTEALNGVEANALDVCLPTDSHPQAACEGFAAGLHVFCEKPIALNLADAQCITAAARKAKKQLMVGHCLRFWEEYQELKKIIQSGSAGPLRALTLLRRSPRPAYTAENWTSDPQRCLGAALDLHVHDTDLVHFLIGTPDAVYSRSLKLPSGWDHIQTQYIFHKGPMVMAECGWTYPANRPFEMGYNALFKNGALDFNNTNEPPLRKIIGDQFFNPASENNIENSLAGLEAYRKELSYFVDRLNHGLPIEINTGKAATDTLATLLAEIKSASTGKIIQIEN